MGKIYPTAKISERSTIDLGEDSFIGDFTLITVPKLIVGEGSQINSGVKVVGREPCIIGRHVVVGYNVVLITSSDTLAAKMDDASPETERKIVSGPIHLGDYSYIGSGSVVMPNVVVGKYAVVGALSYVPEGTVIPDCMVGWGQPFKPIKRRM